VTCVQSVNLAFGIWSVNMTEKFLFTLQQLPTSEEMKLNN
jgi:hypothetical protein